MKNPTSLKKSAVAALPLLLVALLSACGSGLPGLPGLSACQNNNTADIRFQNSSGSNLTYNVVWDGSTIMSLVPGAISSYQSVSAGVTHTLSFKNAANNALACSTAYPNLSQCTSHTYSCAL